ncbi:MAG: thiamine phosphate synthase [Nitrospinae bacterium]|nr:thiamine phosphate synthase [Nitrospinota bacterium]
MKIICIGRSGGENGIEADMRALRSLGHGCGIVSTSSADNVAFQLEQALGGLFAERAVIKAGALGNGDAGKALGESFALRDDLIVYEPPSGTEVAESFIPHVSLLVLKGNTEPEEWLRRGAKAVILRGEDGTNRFRDGQGDFWISGGKPVVDSQYSCAVCAALAEGNDMREAVTLAIARERLSGNVPVSAPIEPDALPSITFSGQAEPPFPPIESTGTEFYPIVDRTAWIKRLAPLGIAIFQLRIKDLNGAELEKEVAEAAEYARANNIRLFINDHWELAMKHAAYGIHLGQEDLLTADLAAIRQAGLRLGISTHNHFEAAVARGLRPSYAALGPVFFTKLKTMRFAPQGVEKLARWKKLLPCPIVAIGGITLENAPDVLKAEPDFISVVGDIANAPDPEDRATRWLSLFSRHR